MTIIFEICVFHENIYFIKIFIKSKNFEKSDQAENNSSDYSKTTTIDNKKFDSK